MSDQGMKKAIDEFVLTRINHAGKEKSIEVSDALERLTADVEKLQTTFTNEQQNLLVSSENKFDMLVAEIQNCYYRAGF